MSGLIRKTWRYFSGHGASETLKRVALHIVRRIYQQETHLIYSLDLNSSFVPSVTSEKYSFKFINACDTAIIRQIEEMEGWLRDQVAGRLRKGGRCVVALDGEMVAGFLLGNQHEMILPPNNFEKSLRPGECFGEQITVHENCRRQGLSSLIRDAFLVEMKKQGMRKHYASVNALNTISITASEKYGYHYLAHLSCRRIGRCACMQLKRVRSTHQTII